VHSYIPTINEAKTLTGVTDPEPEAQAFSLEEVENNEYFDEESDDCESQLLDEANSDAETLMGEDAAALEAEFGGNSEAELLRGIARSPTTIEYHPAPPVIIGTSTREDSESTIYLNPFAPFGNAEEFKLVRHFLESRTPKHKIDDFFNQGLAKVSNSSTITSAYTMDRALDSMCGGLPQWKHGTTVAADEQVVDFYYRNPVECAAYLIRQPCYAADLAFTAIRERDADGNRIYGEMNSADWWWNIQVSFCI